MTGPWQTAQWTAPIPEATSALLAKQVKIPAEAIPDNVQVETFVDNDFPRPAADDIYFMKRNSDPTPARPTPFPTRGTPFNLLTPVFGAGLLTVMGWRRRNS
jgi:hypothetical protein